MSRSKGSRKPCDAQQSRQRLVDARQFLEAAKLLDAPDVVATNAIHAAIAAADAITCHALGERSNDGNHVSAVDLLRSGRRERLDSLVSGGVDGEDATDHFDPSNDLDDRTPVPWIDSTGDDAIAPLVRWVLQLHLVDRPTRDAWVTSAGLVLSHLSDHPELALAPEIPVPAPRSRAAHHGPRWAALAYAGRLDCFEDPETGAVRQRRSVALRRIERTFADAVHQAAHATDQDMVKAREVER